MPDDEMDKDKVELPEFNGALYLLVDKEETNKLFRELNVAEQSRIIPEGEEPEQFVRARFIHVMSRPQKMEIRGYAIIDGWAYLRLPARPLEWGQVDRMVQMVLGIECIVVEPDSEEKSRESELEAEISRLRLQLEVEHNMLVSLREDLKRWVGVLPEKRY